MQLIQSNTGKAAKPDVLTTAALQLCALPYGLLQQAPVVPPLVCYRTLEALNLAHRSNCTDFGLKAPLHTLHGAQQSLITEAELQQQQSIYTYIGNLLNPVGDVTGGHVTDDVSDKLLFSVLGRALAALATALCSAIKALLVKIAKHVTRYAASRGIVISYYKVSATTAHLLYILSMVLHCGLCSKQCLYRMAHYTTLLSWHRLLIHALVVQCGATLLQLFRYYLTSLH
jgi:hypothetical protein